MNHLRWDGIWQELKIVIFPIYEKNKMKYLPCAYCERLLSNEKSRDKHYLKVHNKEKEVFEKNKITMKNFIVFVDGMDGDIYSTYNNMINAIERAFKYDAKEVVIKKWN